MNYPVPQRPTTLPSSTFDFSSAFTRSGEIIEGGTADNTRKAHESDLRYFWAWAELTLGLVESYPIPEAVILLFITDHRKGLDSEVEKKLRARKLKCKEGAHKVSTITRRLATLSYAHRTQGLSNPCSNSQIQEIMKKARNEAVRLGDASKSKRALTRDYLDRLLATCGDYLADVRDRALLLLAFSSGGRRRSEVAALLFEDLDQVPEGYEFRLRQSKTDQDGTSSKRFPVDGRAASALERWLSELAMKGITSGYLFRSIDRWGHISKSGLTPDAVCLIVKRRAELAGLDPSVFGAHSLRSGFMTEGARRGIELAHLMALSGHESVQVAMKYVQAGNIHRNPASRLGD